MAVSPGGRYLLRILPRWNLGKEYEKSIVFQGFWNRAYFRHAGLRHIRGLQVGLELYARSGVATSHRCGCAMLRT